MSITERPVQAALKTMLVNNEPIQYAHLIKFERPSRPDSLSGLVSTAKQRYTYLTDASINVDFDDGSTDLQGNVNGTQTYLANKVLSVGTIQETTKAAVSSTSLVLDGTGLGATISGYTANITLISTGVWDIVFQTAGALNDILGQGFREGDKIYLTLDATSKYVNINSFRSGETLRVTKIDDNLTTGTGVSVSMSLSSEEIISVLLNKTASDYSSFINREVYIYRGYFKDGVIVGAPILIFKGIIYSVSFEDSETGIKVNWGLTSHWGDFAQVRGRVTSDSAHRALNESGVPQPTSALKPIYAYDKGFNHSETSINVLAQYTVLVEKITDIKSKKGFLGIGAGVKVTKAMVPEDRKTLLDFELNAKSIPVVYGVRLVEGIGVFADTLNTDSSTVYVVTVLSEGEVSSIYDVIIDGNSLICNDKADYDARSTQTSDNTVKLVCRGRADRGDALGGQKITSGINYFFNSAGELVSLGAPFNFTLDYNYPGYNLANYTDAVQYDTSGIVDGETINLTSPQSITLDFFSGKSGQKASAQLCNIAYSKGFKIQNSYWKGSDTSEYWGPNHRLLDTAYVVGKFVIAEGETTIPEIKYVVKGKVIDCYNYDYSYSHDAKTTGESAANFILGQTVTLTTAPGGVAINSLESPASNSYQIIDKWTIKNPDGTENVRFRFDNTPNLNFTNGVPSITKFKMTSGTNNWTMVTYNYGYLTDTVPGAIAVPITSVTGSGANIIFNYDSNSYINIENDPNDTSPKLQIVTSTFDALSTGNLFRGTIMTGTSTTTTFTSGYPYSTFGTEAQSVYSGNYLASKNTVRLSAAASATNDYYTGAMLEITRYNSSTGKSIVQSGQIVGYDGTTKIATIDTIWDFIPNTGDSVRIYPKYLDSRVSTNPAIQLLDYVTSKTYGRGLDYSKDLDLPSWLETARKCDTQSNVTILSSSAMTNIEKDDVFRLYASDGTTIVWQGTVSKKPSAGNKYVEFTKCIGKLSNKWNDWKTYSIGDIIYNSSYAYYRVTTAGTLTVEPPGTQVSGSGTASLLTTLALTKISGTGTVTSIPLDLTQGNFVQSIKNGSKISGYSLYDADDINFWRLTGWEEHAQRYVTKNQTNLIIDTAAPLFDNINSLLEHFNGILRYTAGKYYLDIEEAATTISTSDVRTITTDDIIGKIQLSDEGTRSAFNSLTAAFADPANKFEAKSISFFNSEYLKADRNVPKKGNLSIPGITNYYNTRLLADSFLNKSRYGLTISMTVRTHGMLLLAGTIIQVIYPRYGSAWNSPGKMFRIDTITYQPDGMADIVAREYDDSFYVLSNIRTASGTGPTVIGKNTGIGNPSNLIVTSADSATELMNGVELFWDNDPNANATYVSTEVYGGLSPHLFITVTGISGATLTTSSNHGLEPGMPIYPQDSGNGISSSVIYYVVSAPSKTTFTMATSRSASTGDTFTTGTVAIKIRTATLLANVPVPSRSYIDNVPNEGTGRVEKYYWIRHKVDEI